MQLDGTPMETLENKPHPLLPGRPLILRTGEPASKIPNLGMQDPDEVKGQQEHGRHGQL